MVRTLFLRETHGESRLTLSEGTLFPDDTECIPTVIDNAFAQGLIDEQLIGISFAPTTSIESTNGELTFGSVDTSKFTGDLNFVYDMLPYLRLYQVLTWVFTGPSQAPRPQASSSGLTKA